MQKTKSNHKTASSGLKILSGFIFTFYLLVLNFDLNTHSAIASSVNATITSSISVSINAADVEIPIIATPQGTYGSANTNILIATNANGYQLYISDEDQETNLVNEQFSEPKIPTLSSAVTLPAISDNPSNSDIKERADNFPKNSWGYSIDNITFRGISSDLTLIKEVNNFLPSGSDDISVYFAAKVDSSISAGVYRDTLIYSIVPIVVSEETEIRTIFDIDTMQEMQGTICDNTPTPSTNAIASSRDLAEIKNSVNTEGKATLVPETILRDTRNDGVVNGRDYLIRKLADGNCWMVQNLELNLSADNILTSEDSDISPERVTSAGTGRWSPINETQTSTGISWSDSSDTARSYSPALANSPNLYLKDGYIASPTGEPYERIGNYYNWFAATAGTGTYSLANTNATDSICPKGWMLPVGGNSSNKSFKELIIDVYNPSATPNGSAYAMDDSSTLAAPLNFNRSGYYATTTLGGVGVYLYYWSQSAWTDKTYADALHYNTEAKNYFWAGTNPMPKRAYGLTLRCVSK